MAIHSVGIPIVGPVLEPFHPGYVGVLHHHSHEAGSRLDQASRENSPLPPGVTAVALSQPVIFPRQVKGIANLPRAQHLQGLGIEMIPGREDAAGIDVPAQAVNSLEQANPVVKPVDHLRVDSQALDLEAILVGIRMHDERMGVHPQIGRSEAIDIHGVTIFFHQRYIAGQGASFALSLERFDGKRTRHRSIVDKARRLGRLPAGEEALVPTAMIGKRMPDRAYDVVPVGAAGVHRHQLADIEPAHVGRNRPELSTVVAGSIRLHIVHLHMRRTTGQPDENDRCVAGGLTRSCGLSAQAFNFSKAETAGGQAADLEERTTRKRPGTFFFSPHIFISTLLPFPCK